MTGRCAYGDRSGPFEFVRIVGYCAASVRRRRRAQRHWGLTTSESWALVWWSETRRKTMKYKLEYIWLDGYEPVPNLRSKTKIVDFETEPTLDQLPLWNFDGSSTRQADGSSSDCFLKPVALFPDPARDDGRLVMCEVLLPDGTPHPSNSRSTIPDDPGAWFGFEQEYFLYKDGSPLGFPKEGFPAPQGEYYTGVGFKNVGDIARQIVDGHIDLCRGAGSAIGGVNAEVARGRWESQISCRGAGRAGD